MLNELVEKEVRLTGELVAVLKQEQDVLVRADIDALAVVLGNKNKTVDKLTEQSHKRLACMKEHGFSDKVSDVAGWALSSLQDKHTSDTFIKHWNTLLKVASDAKELNRVNGLLIHKHNVAVRQRLDVIRGANPATYDPSGRSSRAVPSRTIVVG